MLQRDDGGRHIPSVHMKDEGASGWGDWAPPCDIYAHVPAGTSAYVTARHSTRRLRNTGGGGTSCKRTTVSSRKAVHPGATP